MLLFSSLGLDVVLRTVSLDTVRLITMKWVWIFQETEAEQSTWWRGTPPFHTGLGHSGTWCVGTDIEACSFSVYMCEWVRSAHS